MISVIHFLWLIGGSLSTVFVILGEESIVAHFYLLLTKLAITCCILRIFQDTKNRQVLLTCSKLASVYAHTRNLSSITYTCSYHCLSCGYESIFLGSLTCMDFYHSLKNKAL